MSREDLETVLTAVIPAARLTLSSGEQFFPFAGGLLANEDRVVEVTARSTAARKSPAAALEHVHLELREAVQRGDYRAVGVCTDVHVEHDEAGRTDAIRAHLEHQNGASIDVFLPYRRNEEGVLEFGELIGGETGLVFFPQPPGTYGETETATELDDPA